MGWDICVDSFNVKFQIRDSCRQERTGGINVEWEKGYYVDTLVINVDINIPLLSAGGHYCLLCRQKYRPVQSCRHKCHSTLMSHAKNRVDINIFDINIFPTANIDES